MSFSGALLFVLLVNVAVATSEKLSRKAGAAKVSDPEENYEPLAGHILKLFRRSVETDAGPQVKRLENNGLILIRGSLLRNVLHDTTVSLHVKFNFSDYHFFGVPIPSDYHVYVLVDESFSSDPNGNIRSVKLGGCKAGLPGPRSNTTGHGVERMLSASNEELENWLTANEARVEESASAKLCHPVSRIAKRVQVVSVPGPVPGPLGAHAKTSGSLMSYALFEWSPQKEQLERSPTFSSLYIRGALQRATTYSNTLGAQLFKIKELRDMWIIATNRRLNFSADRTIDSDEKTALPANANHEICQIGPQVERNAEGKVQYVNKMRMNADALLLFAAPRGEILMSPRGTLCIKSCASAPLRPIGWFDAPDGEARCPGAGPGGLAIATGCLGRAGHADGPQPASPSLNASALVAALKNAEVMFSAEKSAGGQANSASVSGLLQTIGQCTQRVCLPLESRYEPIVFRHRQNRQRCLYYRFELMPLGAKSCCCY